MSGDKISSWCPFCSGTDCVFIIRDLPVVLCNNCGATGPKVFVGITKDQREYNAINNWKNRAYTRHYESIVLENDTYDLKYCPWCREYELEFIRGQICCVRRLCKAKGPIGKTKQEAVELWNK